MKIKRVFLINHSSTEKEVISALIQALPQQRTLSLQGLWWQHEDPLGHCVTCVTHELPEACSRFPQKAALSPPQTW